MACSFIDWAEVLWPSQPKMVMLSVSLPNHTFPGQAMSSKWLTNICAHTFTRNGIKLYTFKGKCVGA